jgi:hypothetical protein
MNTVRVAFRALQSFLIADVKFTAGLCVGTIGGGIIVAAILEPFVVIALRCM